MRITYLHQYFNTPSMAGGTRSFEFARRLVQMGHEVNLVTTRRDRSAGSGWRTTVEEGVIVHWISVPYDNSMGFTERLKAFFTFAWHGANKAASIPAEVIFATSTPLTIAIPAIFAKWRLKVPLVMEIRDLWPKIPIAMGVLTNPILIYFAQCLEQFTYSQSDKIIALSPDMLKGILELGVPQEKLEMIPNGADPYFSHTPAIKGINFKKQHNIPADALILVYAGTFGQVNGVSYLVRLAAALANDPRLFILLIGDGQEAKKIKELATSLGVLGRNLQIFDPVPKSKMPEILSAADIVASTVISVPELEANSANKVFDGLAAGKCIAINHGGWLADILENNDAGMVLSQNVDEAASQIHQLLDNPLQITQKKENAQKLAKDVFNRDLLAAKLEEILLESGERGRG